MLPHAAFAAHTILRSAWGLVLNAAQYAHVLLESKIGNCATVHTITTHASAKSPMIDVDVLAQPLTFKLLPCKTIIKTCQLVACYLTHAVWQRSFGDRMKHNHFDRHMNSIMQCAKKNEQCKQHCRKAAQFASCTHRLCEQTSTALQITRIGDPRTYAF